VISKLFHDCLVRFRRTTLPLEVVDGSKFVDPKWGGRGSSCWGAHFGVFEKRIPDFLITVHLSYFDVLKNRSNIAKDTWFSVERSLRCLLNRSRSRDISKTVYTQSNWRSWPVKWAKKESCAISSAVTALYRPPMADLCDTHVGLHTHIRTLRRPYSHTFHIYRRARKTRTRQTLWVLVVVFSNDVLARTKHSVPDSSAEMFLVWWLLAESIYFHRRHIWFMVAKPILYRA